jgi:dTDP-glucose 4,6-dehydratase
MLFISSGAARSAVTPYGKQKREWERVALDAGAVVARCYSFVGPNLPLDGQFAIGNFIRDGLAGGPIRVKGNGKAIRSYLYETDMARWLWSLLDKDGIYEVGSPFGFSTHAVARMVSDAFLLHPEVIIENQPDEPCETYLPGGEFPCGMGQTVGLEDAIAMTIAAHQ